MTYLRAWSLAASAPLALLLACSTPLESSSPCSGSSPLTGCGNRCTAGTPCPTGLYCTSGGSCGADCDWAAQTGCNAGEACGANGQCGVVGTDGAVITDGGVPDNICADVSLNTNHTTPNVILIIDRSGSMTGDFGRGTRWSVLRNSLTATPDGLIHTLQGSVRFGLAMYSGQSDTGVACPNLVTVNPALDNYDAINTIYQANEPDHGTPTGESINAVVANSALSMSNAEPTIFVLATDGAPNACSGTGVDGKPASVAAVQAAHDIGIRTYVIGVGSDVDLDDAHLTDLANAGLGHTSGPDEMFWRVNDEAGLTDALMTIVGGTISCDIELTNGSIDTSIPGVYCAGSSVALNGTALPCDDPNGWTAVDSTHIRLQGTACDALLATGGGVTATFPCGIVLF